MIRSINRTASHKNRSCLYMQYQQSYGLIWGRKSAQNLNFSLPSHFETHELLLHLNSDFFHKRRSVLGSRKLMEWWEIIPEVEFLNALLENCTWRDEWVGKAKLHSWSWWRLSETCTGCSRKWNLVRRRNDGDDTVEDTNGTDIECVIIRVREKWCICSSTMNIALICTVWCAKLEVYRRWN
jgi:hypothetical protein